MHWQALLVRRYITICNVYCLPEFHQSENIRCKGNSFPWMQVDDAPKGDFELQKQHGGRLKPLPPLAMLLIQTGASHTWPMSSFTPDIYLRQSSWVNPDPYTQALIHYEWEILKTAGSKGHVMQKVHAEKWLGKMKMWSRKPGLATCWITACKSYKLCGWMIVRAIHSFQREKSWVCQYVCTPQQRSAINFGSLKVYSF